MEESRSRSLTAARCPMLERSCSVVAVVATRNREGKRPALLLHPTIADDGEQRGREGWGIRMSPPTSAVPARR
nr:hypothetical protein Itr_chr08CG15800 [Ipomoea trifida]